MKEKASTDDGKFIVKPNGNVAPAGPEEIRAAQEDAAKNLIPMPYAFKANHKDDDRQGQEKNQKDVRVENVGDAPAQSDNNVAPSSSSSVNYAKKSSSKEPLDWQPKNHKSEGVENSQIRPEERQNEDKVQPSGFDEIGDIQDKVAGILNQN